MDEFCDSEEKTVYIEEMQRAVANRLREKYDVVKEPLPSRVVGLLKQLDKAGRVDQS